MYKQGQLVQYLKDGKPKWGNVLKVYASGKGGAIKIHPADGSHNITRRLVGVMSLE